MGQNQLYAATNYGHPHPEPNSKAMCKDKAMGDNNTAPTTVRSSTQTGNEHKKSKRDVWGPIYQNKQHFVDMHIC